MKRFTFLRTVVLWLFALSSAVGQAQQSTVTYDSHCLQIDGKDQFIYSGAFHYFRCPQALWKDRFQKIKEAGFNAVETYVPWNWHEREMPQSAQDFSKINMQELKDWMAMAESFGFYIIIRPGPYICAEWDGGGFPQWLVAYKKPLKPLRDYGWLQTDDPEFLKWNKHWYQAVCQVVAPHQVTRKAKGQPGVIMFQIENEYNRLKYPSEMKKTYLEELAQYARQGGIDVPVFTCWTNESRNVQQGSLKGVFDFVNVYPRWEIEKKMHGFAARQKQSQPYAPLMYGELQGGWYSEVGGLSSEKQEGISGVQTQNITLYTMQLGSTLINYYMLCGGTNFDDWASRETTTTYDFHAPIHEDGRVGGKYYRLKAIGQMLSQYGTQLARTDRVDSDVTLSDSAVEVAERRTPEGHRFIFVRTEDRTRSHQGNVVVSTKGEAPMTLPYALEPFGSAVFYLPAGSNDIRKGEWFPKLKPQDIEEVEETEEVLLKYAGVSHQVDELPTHWISLKAGDKVEDAGIYHRHYLYYKVEVPAGKEFTVRLLGDKVVNGSKGDAVVASVNGRILTPVRSKVGETTFLMPTAQTEVILLYENRGLHHHTHQGVEENWLIGIKGVVVDGQPVPLQFASTEREFGLKHSVQPAQTWKVIPVKTETKEALLVWHSISFPCMEPRPGRPYRLSLKAQGNGFMYLNGHCIGRYWNENPLPTEYYLPECWLNTAKDKPNVITFSLRPVGGSVMIHELFLK